MYLGIVKVDSSDFKSIVNDYDADIKVEKFDDYYIVNTDYLEACLDIHSIFENEQFLKITSLIIPKMYGYDQNCISYVSSNKDKLLYVEDYLWHCITHSVESTLIKVLEDVLLGFEYDELFLLYKYIENGGNASSTAKSMYIHRNTMDYKLNKWSKVFMLNIKRPKTLMIMSFLINKNDLIK